jgi:hypothetical protein
LDHTALLASLENALHVCIVQLHCMSALCVCIACLHCAVALLVCIAYQPYTDCTSALYIHINIGCSHFVSALHIRSLTHGLTRCIYHLCARIACAHCMCALHYVRIACPHSMCALTVRIACPHCVSRLHFLQIACPYCMSALRVRIA